MLPPTNTLHLVADIPVWSSWEVIIPCFSTCGRFAFRSKRRMCVHDNGSLASLTRCSGSGFVTERCSLPVCPVFDETSLDEGKICDQVSVKHVCSLPFLSLLLFHALCYLFYDFLPF